MERLAGTGPMSAARRNCIASCTTCDNNYSYFDPAKFLTSAQVQFAGRDAFVKQLEDSLKKRKTPLLFSSITVRM